MVSLFEKENNWNVITQPFNSQFRFVFHLISLFVNRFAFVRSKSLKPLVLKRLNNSRCFRQIRLQEYFKFPFFFGNLNSKIAQICFKFVYGKLFVIECCERTTKVKYKRSSEPNEQSRV